MTEDSFQVGDVVRLKSGGPIMTVGVRDKLGYLECHWFDGNEPKWNSFKPEMLEKAERPKARRV